MDQELYVVGQLLRMAEQFASLGDETGASAWPREPMRTNS